MAIGHYGQSATHNGSSLGMHFVLVGLFNMGTLVQNWHFDDNDDIIQPKKTIVEINKIFDATFSFILYFVFV